MLTLSPTAPNLTDKTAETNAACLPTTNSQFLNIIFAGLAERHRPFVLGFAGKPKDCKAWGGVAWCTDKCVTESPAFNWYFSLATYAPADDGYHRREKDCATVYGLMLDDLGTKALPLDRLDACPPSYVIETSEGNFQAGYLFKEPEIDFDSIKALNQSMVEAGLCDPGAKSPSTRYGRLPFASILSPSCPPYHTPSPEPIPLARPNHSPVWLTESPKLRWRKIGPQISMP